jgi:hypothetical protein
MEQIDQANAEHAQQYANCTREEVLEILGWDVPPASAALRALGDDQLDRTAVVLAGAPPMSTEQVIESILIGHAAGHLESIRAASS